MCPRFEAHGGAHTPQPLPAKAAVPTMTCEYNPGQAPWCGLLDPALPWGVFYDEQGRRNPGPDVIYGVREVLALRATCRAFHGGMRKDELVGLVLTRALGMRPENAAAAQARFGADIDVFVDLLLRQRVFFQKAEELGAVVAGGFAVAGYMAREMGTALGVDRLHPNELLPGDVDVWGTGTACARLNRIFGHLHANAGCPTLVRHDIVCEDSYSHGCMRRDLAAYDWAHRTADEEAEHRRVDREDAVPPCQPGDDDPRFDLTWFWAPPYSLKHLPRRTRYVPAELDDDESAQVAHFVSQVRGTGHWRDDEPLGDTEPAYTIESAHRTILLAGPQLYDYGLPAEYPHCARRVKVVTPGVLERVQVAVWGAAALVGDIKVVCPGRAKYSGEFEVFPLKHKFSSINFIVLDAEPVPQRLLDGFDLRHCGVAVRIGRTRPGTLHLDFQLSPATAAAIAERRLEPTAHFWPWRHVAVHPVHLCGRDGWELASNELLRRCYKQVQRVRKYEARGFAWGPPTERA